MKKSLLFLLCLMTILAAHAQCPQRYLDDVFPVVKINKNINFGGRKTNTDGTKTWLEMDVYEPKHDTAQLRPLVVLIHGGGFTNSTPLFRATPDIFELAQSLARKGYVVMSPEYRLFSGENTADKILETAVAGILDVNEAACYLVNTVSQGNPFRIDTSKFFIGGSSAGAILALYSSLISDTSDIPLALRPAMRKVANFDNINIQDILQNKFRGMRPRVVVPISGALIDTEFVKHIDASVLIIHGGIDAVIPNGEGYLKGDPTLLHIYGPDIMIGILERAGMSVEADIYPNDGHVPVIWNFSGDLFNAIITTLTTGSAVNPPVMDSTKRHMASMFYKALGSPETICNTADGILDHAYIGEINLYPNPSTGIFTMQIPTELQDKNINVRLFDLTGQIVYEKVVKYSNTMTMDLSSLNKGMYIMGIANVDANSRVVYIDKLVKQ